MHHDNLKKIKINNIIIKKSNITIVNSNNKQTCDQNPNKNTTRNNVMENNVSISKSAINKNITDNNINKIYKKKKIPAALRTAVWNEYCGRVFDEKCYTGCGEIITVHNFTCGRVIAESNGGDTILENLRPICANCNLSMGRENMQDFIIRYGFKSRFNFTNSQHITNPNVISNIKTKFNNLFKSDVERLTSKKEIANYITKLIGNNLNNIQIQTIRYIINNIEKNEEINTVIQLLCTLFYQQNNVYTRIIEQKIKDNEEAHKLFDNNFMM